MFMEGKKHFEDSNVMAVRWLLINETHAKDINDMGLQVIDWQSDVVDIK